MSSNKHFLVLFVITLSEGFHIHIDNFELCDKEEQLITFDINVKNDGDKQILEYGLLDTKIDMNNDIQNTITLYKHVENGWHSMISKTDPVCIMVENIMGDLAKSLENTVGLTQGCPYPKGKYEVKNYPLDFEQFKYKEFPPGKNKMKSEFFAKDDDKKRIGCYEVEFTVEK
ncbi:uncharacterized protein LOC130891229 [Diorhabda carinulata]|uniref:uncharacterized protein LOC130891229 n=1 Tax=Diorhabda carinulata TaxID=1163345 RepID=UPI0025A23B4F|nr:uncharacterized protein LOC130891229 [Diorhabda carinulata]